MRSVNTATRNAWNTISYTKVRIYLPNLETSISDDYISSVSMEEAISDTDNMFFVGCVSTKVEITLNNFSTNLHLQPVEIYVRKGTTTELKIFTGKIYTCDIDGKNNTCKIVCYDAMYRIFNADVTDWYNGLTFPMTLKAFRNSFFARFDISQKSTTLLFDSMTVENSIGGEQILGRDIIKPLCEANVCFGHIGFDGKMNYLSITSNNRTVPVGEVSNMWNAKYTTDAVSKVVVRESEEDIGAISGSGSNAYIVQGNMFFLGKSSSELQGIADSIFSTISNITFVPTESTQQYNAVYELGDLITIPDYSGNVYQSIILQRETDFQRETTKAKGLKDYSLSASYTNVDLISLLGRSNKLYRDINETRSTIANVAEGLQTEITQTADGLQIQIDEIHSEINGEISYYEREGVPTLLNYPYWDFTTSIPCNNTIQLDEIYTKAMNVGGEKFPHFYYSEQDKKSHRNNICFDNLTGISYKFAIEDGTWYWKEITDSEYTYIMARVSTLEATAEQLSSEYTELSLNLSDNYWTSFETQSAITQSASEITSTVASTYQTISSMADYYTSSETDSKITQKANEITTSVAETYQTIANMSGYQTTSGMTNYYTKSQADSQITQKANEITTSVASTYQTLSGMSAYQDKAGMSDYQTTAGMSSYYTKSQTDSKITQKGNQIMSSVSESLENYQLISGMSDYQTVEGMSNYQTLSGMSNYYTKSQADSIIEQTAGSITASVFETLEDYQLIAGMSAYQTKSGMSAYQTVAGMSDYQTVSGMSDYQTKSGMSAYQTVAGMNNYQLKSSMGSYYTKTETDAAINTSKSGILLTVSQNYQTQANMVNYYTKTVSDNRYQTQSGMSNYQTKAGMNAYQTVAAMSNYYTSLQVDNVISSTRDGILLSVEQTYQTQEAMSGYQTTSAMSNYYTKSEIDLSNQGIRADVVAHDGGSQASFGWHLASDKFDLYSNGSRVFRCDSNGIQINGSGTFSGSVEATSGTIGGWAITSGSLYGGNTYIESDGNIYCYISGQGTKWLLKSDGSFFAANANIAGNIIASSGSIGNWTITNGKLSNGSVSIQADGSIVCTISNQVKWALQNDGTLIANSAVINGYTKTSDFSALQGSFNTLNAKAITTDNFSAQNINANKITSGTISTSRLDINGLVASFAGKAIACYSLSATYGYFGTGLYLFDNNVQYGFTRKSAVINGQTLHYWGW